MARRSPVTWLMPLGTIAQFMLPRWIVKHIARFAGRLAYRLNRKQRERLHVNYRHILGPNATERDVGRMAERAFVRVVTNYLDLLRIPVLKKRALTLIGGDDSPLAQTMELGRGAIVVTAHIGNWDLAGAGLGALGYPVSAVVEPVPAGWSATFNRYRGATGLHTIPIPDRHAIHRALKDKRVLALVADRDFTGRGLACPSFDALRTFPRGPAAHSLKTGAPIVMGYVLFDDTPGRPPYRIHVEPPFDLEPTGNLDADIASLTRKIAERINAAIARFPDQWLVFRADWR